MPANVNSTFVPVSESDTGNTFSRFSTSAEADTTSCARRSQSPKYGHHRSGVALVSTSCGAPAETAPDMAPA